MPIEVDAEVNVISENEFHVLAEKIIGIAFEVQNDFGRLMEEEIFKRAIGTKCAAAGIVPIRREVEIKVSFGEFLKSYFMDLFFVCALMVEAKAVEKLNNSHATQTLNYLLLTGMKHGLLLNLRSNRVEKRFVSTTLDLAQRRRFTIRDGGWKPINKPSVRIRELFLELLDDWGLFLQTSLYRQALIEFFGGPSVALRRIPIYDIDEPVGTQQVFLVAEDTALALTALKDGKDAMSKHLQRFVEHTELDHIQWINMDKHLIEFDTLSRTNSRMLKSQ